MVGLGKHSYLGCIRFRLSEAEKQYIIEKIEHQLLFYDKVVVTISKKELGESSRGGMS